MRKSQSQPSLASLSEADREQLAEWLRREEYHAVLAQVNRPRPGGFGLTIKSDRPLRTFYAKVALLDVINARLPEDKKIPLALFESLARRDIYLLTSADNDKLVDAHVQILRTTADLASDGDNTPAQILTLQRLADFPERAALRAAKEERAEESHAWKREMLDHKKEMDQHRKQIAERSIAVREAHLTLSREESEHRRANSSNSQRSTLNSQLPPQEDHLGPYAADLEGIRERARKHFGITPEESARRAELRRTWKDPNAHLNQRLDPNTPVLLHESPNSEPEPGNQNDLPTPEPPTQKL